MSCLQIPKVLQSVVVSVGLLEAPPSSKIKSRKASTYRAQNASMFTQIFTACGKFWEIWQFVSIPCRQTCIFQQRLRCNESDFALFSALKLSVTLMNCSKTQQQKSVSRLWHIPVEVWVFISGFIKSKMQMMRMSTNLMKRPKQTSKKSLKKQVKNFINSSVIDRNLCTSAPQWPRVRILPVTLHCTSSPSLPVSCHSSAVLKILMP